jgi:chromosome segregation ATPase
MEATSKALAVLNSDEAHDLFGKTFGFVQVRSTVQSDRRAAASKILSAIAKKIQNPRLSQLAYRVKLDAFTKVKKAIDDMIADLTEEKKAEIKLKDFCIDEFNTNQKVVEQKTAKKEDQQAQIEDLTTQIATLTDAINTLTSEIEDLNKELKKAGEDREAENKEFQQTVADQRATQKLLSAAMAVLKGFYDKEHEVYDLHKGLLLQKKPKTEPAGPPPPPDFADYQKQPSGGVLGLIAQIIKDAKAMEAEAIKDEGEAVAAYEDFVSVSNESIDSDKKAIAEKKEQKAKAEVALATAEKDLDFVISELDGLAAYKAELHSACDYVLKNFDIRQTKRGEEIEALKQAKAILSGAKFEAFLQKRS